LPPPTLVTKNVMLDACCACTLALVATNASVAQANAEIFTVVLTVSSSFSVSTGSDRFFASLTIGCGFRKRDLALG
jgi:hypothetical protein